MDALLGELPTDDDAWGPVVLFATELMRKVPAGATSDTDLVEARKTIPSAQRQSWTIWEVANARTEAGRLTDVEALARYGLETLSSERMLEPRLWHVRAEAARLGGRWDLVQDYLDRMAASIPPDATYEARANAPDAEHQNARWLQAQNHQYRSRLLQGRTHVLIEFGLPDLAKAPALEAISEAEQGDDASALAAARLLAIERSLMRFDGEDNAIALARESCTLKPLEPWQPLFRFAEGTAELANARKARRAHDDAEPAARRAREAFTAVLTAEVKPVMELKTELALGELERFLERIDEARAHLARARELALAMGPEGGPVDLAVQIDVLAWRLAHEGGAEAAALEPARRALFEAFQRLLVQWASTPRRAGGVGFLQVAWRAQLVSEVLEAELSAAPAAGAGERAFGRLLATEAMGTRARTSALGSTSPRSNDLAELRAALLSDGRGLLVLLPARDRSHLFLVDAKSVTPVPIDAGRDELRRSAEQVTAWLQDPTRAPDARVTSTLKALSATLLPADVRARIAAWSGVISVGFDLLGGLPFGVLLDEKGEPLARRLALTSLPSATFGLELARRGPAPTGGKDLVLVVASDAPKELDLPPFRFGEDEQRRLLAPFDGRACACLVGKDASREQVLAQKKQLSGARILHFLAHGASLPGHENSAVLVLAPGGADSHPYFTGEDLAALAPAGLVILSACSAGSGPARTGDDCLVHLGGACLDAGARCVLLTRFPVEVEATLALMERVHARLAAGMAPAQALRDALGAAEGASGLSAYHAAAFEVLGLGFEPVGGERQQALPR
jgi:CHAT domain-containing protein